MFTPHHQSRRRDSDEGMSTTPGLHCTQRCNGGLWARLHGNICTRLVRRRLVCVNKPFGRNTPGVCLHTQLDQALFRHLHAFETPWYVANGPSAVQDQAVHSPGCTGCYFLCHHTAHRMPEQVETVDALGIQHREDMLSETRYGIGRYHCIVLTKPWQVRANDMEITGKAGALRGEL